jgi:hypothetical protein
MCMKEGVLSNFCASSVSGKVLSLWSASSVLPIYNHMEKEKLKK